MPFIEAVGAGLITILANSVTTGAAYIHEGLTDLGIGMVLEIATVPGALLGASLTIRLTRYNLTTALLIALAIVLIFRSLSALLRRHGEVPQNVVPDRTSQKLGPVTRSSTRPPARTRPSASCSARESYPECSASEAAS
ncbi:hypothetical protein B1B_03850 [mine drainage metagenome]|uniref:Uncharacterized protein n=1 Tax=mine drainage metagenome TaxID=410659 RepID=T1BQZ8_9ZZZZ